MKKHSLKGLTVESVLKSLAAHPYLWALAVCMVVHFIFLSDVIVHLTAYSSVVELMILQIGGSIIIFKLHDKKKLNFIQFILVELVYVLAIFGLFFLYSASRIKIVFIFGFSAAVFTALFVYLIKTEKVKDAELKEKLISLFIMCLGFALKMAYSLSTTSTERQYDLTNENEYGGHLGYIKHLMDHHHLWNETDPREMWQHYHPPLHHIISSIWVSFNRYVLQLSDGHSIETIKTLCLFYSMCIMISCYKILKHFKLKGKSLFIPLILINFCPQFVYFSASMNNDVLSVAFIMGAFACVLEWYRNRTMKNILKIALCIGLGMMSKMSAALIAPPVALLFLIAFIKNIKTEWKKLIGQFACFGLVCIPLGLWFSFRNYLKWGIPFNYVQRPPMLYTDMNTYNGMYSITQKLFDFSPYQYSPDTIFIATDDYFGYAEFNPLIGLFKSSVFSNYMDRLTFGQDRIFIWIAFILFWVNIVVGVFAFIKMFAGLIKKSEISFAERFFPVVFYCILIGSYYILCLDYPITWSMDFRYVSPVVPIGAIFIGLYQKRLYEKNTVPDGAEVSRKVKTMDTLLKVFTVTWAVMCTVIIIAACCPHKGIGMVD